MTAPGIVPGLLMASPAGFPDEVQGRFFSSFPAATPKFAQNNGPRRSEFTETMARVSIVASRSRVESLLRNLPAAVSAAATTLLYGGDVTAMRDGNAAGAGYFDFILTSVQQAHQEREQAVDTLTDNTVVFYSGESSPMLSCSGYFLNTYQDDQNVWFQLLYSHLLRGSQLARRGLVARLRYDSFFMTGYFTSLNIATTSDVKNAVQFSFGFRVKQIEIATPILYNPSLASSLFSTNLFTRVDAPGVDDASRSGVESASTPLAPTSVPAATANPATEGPNPELPPAEAQAARDAALAAEEAARMPLTDASGAALVEAGVPLTAATASGDVRSQLPQTDRVQVQSFTAPTTAAAPAPTTPTVSTPAARGTVILAEGLTITGRSAAELQQVRRASALADAVSRIPPETTSALRGLQNGTDTVAAQGTFEDIYGTPPPQLVQDLPPPLPPVAPRSRARPTP